MPHVDKRDRHRERAFGHQGDHDRVSALLCEGLSRVGLLSLLTSTPRAPALTRYLGRPSSRECSLVGPSRTRLWPEVVRPTDRIGVSDSTTGSTAPRVRSSGTRAATTQRPMNWACRVPPVDRVGGCGLARL